MKVLVIGGTLFIGRTLVQELVKSGHEVTVLHRKSEHDLGKKVLNLQADRNDAAQIKAALTGKNFEVVFDNVYDWERGTTSAQVEACARAASGDSLKRYVFLSSVAAYADGLNHYEGDALAAENHPDVYMRNKAMTERMLFRLHQRHQFPAVTLRPAYIYGPGNPYYREAFFWDRIRDGRQVIVPSDGRRLMQFVFVKDLVQACLQAMNEPAAVGHAFNIATPKPQTQNDLVQALADTAGKKVEIIRIPRERILRAGGHPLGPQLYFGIYFDMPPITMLVTKAQRVLKFKPTDFPTGMKETYKWWKAHNHFPPPNYAFEDSLLSKLAELTARQVHA